MCDQPLGSLSHDKNGAAAGAGQRMTDGKEMASLSGLTSHRPPLHFATNLDPDAVLRSLEEWNEYLECHVFELSSE